MRDPWYNVVSLHSRPDLIHQCCNLLNSEWKRSDTARLRSLEVSCRSKSFPTCLLLVIKNEVIGHCKISLLPTRNDSVLLESFIIDRLYRCQGLGSLLLEDVENYVKKLRMKNIYLMTKGQEGFYLKNDYVVCEPLKELNDFRDFNSEFSKIKESESKDETEEIISTGPPPPPMPTDLIKLPAQVCLTLPTRTFMKKKLKKLTTEQPVLN